MILESLVTTHDVSGQVNLAPLGPIVADSFAEQSAPEFLLRPYEGSRTCANLIATGRATIHVVDDVLLIAETAVGSADIQDRIEPMTIMGERYWRLKRCHRWFAVEVTAVGGVPPRYEMTARTIQTGTVDSFFGFNRAKHAIIEIAVLATRIGLVPDDEIVSTILGSVTILEKTAGQREREAFTLLWNHVATAIPDLGHPCPVAIADPMTLGRSNP